MIAGPLGLISGHARADLKLNSKYLSSDLTHFFPNIISIPISIEVFHEITYIEVYM